MRPTQVRPRPRWDPATYELPPPNKALEAARNTGEWVAIIAFAVIVALVIKAFVLQAFYIPSESMEPTLFEGDRVLVNKLSYKYSDISRGDVVVFERPPGLDDPSVKDLIKRVIALPGDTIEGIDGKVYVNGKQVDEPYLRPNVSTDDLPKFTIPPGTVWVMGDNRPRSFDSRYFGGPIGQDLVVGRAMVIVWPFNHGALL